MDKMIQSANGDVTITNDGATILKQMSVLHPVARMVKKKADINSINKRCCCCCCAEVGGAFQGTGHRGRGWNHYSGCAGWKLIECESEVTSKRSGLL